jgi:hypothetical protein
VRDDARNRTPFCATSSRANPHSPRFSSDFCWHGACDAGMAGQNPRSKGESDAIYPEPKTYPAVAALRLSRE